MRLAAAYRRNNVILIHPYARATSGIRFLAQPVTIVPEDADAEALGYAVLAALASSRDGVRAPVDWSGVLKPLLDAAKVKNWGRFVTGATLCEIQDDGNTIQITAQENLGPREGFQPLMHSTVVVPAFVSPAEVGTAIRKVLKLAR